MWLLWLDHLSGLTIISILKFYCAPNNDLKAGISPDELTVSWLARIYSQCPSNHKGFLVMEWSILVEALLSY